MMRGEKTFFAKDFYTEVKVTLKTTINAKVVSYNDDVNKIAKEAVQEKNAIENLNFLMNLAMVANPNFRMCPRHSTKPETILILNYAENVVRLFERSL